MEMLSSFGTRLREWLRNSFVLSNTVPFIWGLILSHALVKNAVVEVLMDFLTYKWGKNRLREATMAINLLDGLSAVFVAVVTYVSEGYTGRFNMIIFCTGAYAIGLMLLWVYSFPSTSEPQLVTLIFALVLVALGGAAEDPTLKEFFEYQLSEKVKEKYTENNEGADKESLKEKERSNENRTGTTNHWWTTASFTGAAIAVFWLGRTPWSTTFQISSLVMGTMYLLFYSGFCYYHEERPQPTESPLTTTESPLGTIYRFCYYPAVRKERNGEDCTAERVREVKSSYPIVELGFTFFAYSLVSASANTYFVEQGSNLDPYVGDFEIPFILFFAIKSSIAFVVRKVQSWTKLNSIWSIGIGMFCSVLCSITAWQVEHHRLSLIIKEGVLESYNPDDVTIHLSILVLTPQFFLLGLMEGFAEDGLETFVRDRVPESMSKFVNPCIKMLLATGKFSSIFFVLIFPSWFKESINTSHVEWYFLLLAILSFMFFLIYVCCAPRFKLLTQKSEELETNEGTNIESSSTSFRRRLKLANDAVGIPHLRRSVARKYSDSYLLGKEGFGHATPN